MTVYTTKKKRNELSVNNKELPKKKDTGKKTFQYRDNICAESQR